MLSQTTSQPRNTSAVEIYASMYSVTAAVFLIFIAAIANAPTDESLQSPVWVIYAGRRPTAKTQEDFFVRTLRSNQQIRAEDGS